MERQDFQHDLEGEDRLEALLNLERKHVHGLDVHGATFGEGTEETTMCILGFHTCSDEGMNSECFLLDSEAVEALFSALQDMLPKMKEKETELRAVRN